MRLHHSLGLAAAVTGFCAPVALAAQDPLGVNDPTAYLMDEDSEIVLSRSAAPPAISKDASVLVLSADGNYRMASEGSNGWTCFTGRSWTGPARFKDGKRIWSEANFNPINRAPQCFNAAAAPVLMAHKITTKLFMQGASVMEVDLALGQAITSGMLTPPSTGAMSYMFSPKQVLGPNGGRFFPHLMLYTPFVTQESYGKGSVMQGVPLVTDSGGIFSTTVIVSPNWSDGTPANGE